MEFPFHEHCIVDGDHADIEQRTVVADLYLLEAQGGIASTTPDLYWSLALPLLGRNASGSPLQRLFSQAITLR
jgi:hypothetical protein